MHSDARCRNPGRQLFDVPFMDRIGYAFRDSKLLDRALTHPSLGDDHNQRLEFLGDAVLELCASEALYAHTPALAEGQMTRLRAAMVREVALVKAAEKIGLGDCIHMSEECARSGGRTRPSIVSAALEAVLGAVYLDGGLAAARTMFEKLWLPLDLTAMQPVDDKSALQEWLQARGRETPDYRVVHEEGPAHQRMFLVEVLAQGKVLASAGGSSKKRAEQDAARRALAVLTQREGT